MQSNYSAFCNTLIIISQSVLNVNKFFGLSTATIFVKYYKILSIFYCKLFKINKNIFTKDAFGGIIKI